MKFVGTTFASFQNQGGTSDAYAPVSGGNSTAGQIIVEQPGIPVPAGAVAWLQSPASVPYQGRWVALDSDGTVVADGDSPADFPDAIAHDPKIAIFYVIPAGVKLIG